MRFVDKMRALLNQGKKARQQNPELESQELLIHISNQLSELTDQVETLVEEAVRGLKGSNNNSLDIILTDKYGD